jgi:ATP-binding cassette subfamily B protein
VKLLYQYLSRQRGLIVVALFLAAVNQVFSLLDPYIFGRFVIDPFAKNPGAWTEDQFIRGVLKGLGLLIGTAMVSRIAKAFQDYTVSVVIQKFGAALYTDGLKHALRLPFADFEDQRSGETLSVLQKARADCEKLILNFVNILFGTLIGIVFVIVYALSLKSILDRDYLSRGRRPAGVAHRLPVEAHQDNSAEHRAGDHRPFRRYDGESAEH